MKIEFSVQGSEPEPYLVSFDLNEDLLSANCTCAASTNGQACKHRIQIILGNPEGIVSKNVNQVQIITEAYRNSALLKELLSKQVKENEIEEMKKEIKGLNKRISVLLRKSA